MIIRRLEAESQLVLLNDCFKKVISLSVVSCCHPSARTAKRRRLPDRDDRVQFWQLVDSAYRCEPAVIKRRYIRHFMVADN